MKTSRRASVRRATTRHSIFPARNVLPFYLQFHFAMSVVSRLSAGISPLKKVKQPATIPGNRVVTRISVPIYVLLRLNFTLTITLVWDEAKVAIRNGCRTISLERMIRCCGDKFLKTGLMNDKLRLRWRGRFVCKIIGLINIYNLWGNYCSIKK